MTDPSPVRGYRVLADRKVEKQYSVNNLLLGHAEAKALKNLNDKVTAEEMKKERGEGRGVPCVGRAEEFSGDNLLSERDAELSCYSCPAMKLCSEYFLIARPAHGIYGGKVRNMNIPDD